MADAFETLARLIKPFPLEAIVAVLDGQPSPRFGRDGQWRPHLMGPPEVLGGPCECFDGPALLAGTQALFFLSTALPGGDARRAALPALERAIKARLAHPELLLWGGVHQQGQPSIPDGKPYVPPGYEDAKHHHGLSNEALALACGYLYFRPSRLTRPEDVAVCEAHDPRIFKAWKAFTSPGLARMLARIEAGALEAGGSEQDPRVAAPDVVRSIASRLELDPDAATLYLQLLALADASEAWLCQVNGWTPAQHQRAAMALLGQRLVEEKKQPRANRKLVLPGPWEPLSAPLPAMERWKLPLYEVRIVGKAIESPLGAVLPLRPMGEIFQAAAARLEAEPLSAAEPSPTASTKPAKPVKAAPAATATSFPFPFFGAGPGKGRFTLAVIIQFAKEPSADEKAGIAKEIPTPVARDVRWEGGLLRCGSGPDVEYDLRLAAFESGESSSGTRRSVEAAYDGRNDQAAPASARQWARVFQAIDAWVVAVHSRCPISFCFKSNLAPESEWHSSSLSLARGPLSALREHLRSRSGPWAERASSAAEAALGIVEMLLAADLIDVTFAPERLEVLDACFEGDAASASQAAHWVAAIVKALPANRRRDLVLARIRESPSLLLSALVKPPLVNFLEDEQVLERVRPAFEAAGDKRAWLAVEWVMAAAEIDAERKAKSLAKASHLWRKHALDIAQPHLPFRADVPSDSAVRAQCLQARPLIHALLGEAEAMRSAAEQARALIEPWRPRDARPSLLAPFAAPAIRALLEELAGI
ncbi:MAG: hypothetical protein QM765_21415 [Myxococcales bacterium]